jgi:hypothetical protein
MGGLDLRERERDSSEKKKCCVSKDFGQLCRVWISFSRSFFQTPVVVKMVKEKFFFFLIF